MAFKGTLELIHKANGNVVVPAAPQRRSYAGSALVMAGISFWLFISDAGDVPVWIWRCAAWGVLLSAIWNAWQAWTVAPVEFDVRTGRMRYGGGIPVPFSGIDCIEISKELSDAEDREYVYPVALRMKGGRRIKLGRSFDEMTASDTAAALAGLTGRPVRKF